MKPFHLAAACLLLAAGVSGQRPERPATARPRASEAALPVVRLSGERLFADVRGDSVHPALSPDGTQLAYSKVIVAGGREGTEILLRDLRSGRTSVLLGRRAADRYATYGAFVTEIVWLDNRRFRVTVADGDVDATDLLFDARSRKLVRETHVEPGFDDGSPNAAPVPPEFRRAYARARAVFPVLEDRVLTSALQYGAFLVGGGGLVLQKNYVSEDHDVHLLDFGRRTMQTLLELRGPSSSYRLGGGFAFGPSIIFVVTNGADAVLYEHRDGRATKLLTTPVKEGAPVNVEIKHRSAARVVFLLRTAPAHEKGDNPLLTFDGARLRRAGDYPALHDAHIGARGRRIAFCFWKGGARHLVVAELKD